MSAMKMGFDKAGKSGFNKSGFDLGLSKVLAAGKAEILRQVSKAENSGWSYPKAIYDVTSLSSPILGFAPFGYFASKGRSKNNGETILNVTINRNKGQVGPATCNDAVALSGFLNQIAVGSSITIHLGWNNYRTVAGRTNLPATVFNILILTKLEDNKYRLERLFQFDQVNRFSYHDIRKLALKEVADGDSDLFDLCPAATSGRKFVDDIFNAWHRV